METVENSIQTPEMDRFRDALKGVLTVSKKELDRRLAKEKADKGVRVATRHVLLRNEKSA